MYREKYRIIQCQKQGMLTFVTPTEIPPTPRKHWERLDTHLLSFDSSVLNARWGNAIQNSNSMNL